MKAAIFTRVSSATQVESGYSLGEQEDRLRRYADAQGWPVTEHYEEPGVKVTKRRKRPEVERMLGDAAAEKFDVFLGIAIDRIGRTMGETHRILEALDEAGVRILGIEPGGVADDYSKGAPGATAKRGALALAAAIEGEQIAARAKAGAQAKIARGAYVGGQRPFGYEQPPGEGLQPHPAEAPVLREVFERYANGESLRALAADLSARGVRRPNGGHWVASRVGELLDNSLYIGEVAPGKRGRHEPLVGDTLWRRVRSLRDAKAKLHPQGGRRPREHLLTGGLLRCGACGRSWYPRAYKHSPLVYRCRGRDGEGTDATGCTVPPAPQALVDAAVRQIAARVVTVEDAEAAVKERGAQAKRDARTAAAEVAKYERRLRHLRDEWMDRAISRADYEEWRAEFEAELTAARGRQAEAEALERDLTTNGHDRAAALREAREIALNERPSAEQLDRYRAWLEAHFQAFTLYVRPVVDTDLSETERELAEAQRRELPEIEEAAEFIWKPKGKPEHVGALLAEWRPEVEARFQVQSDDATPPPTRAGATGAS